MKPIPYLPKPSLHVGDVIWTSDKGEWRVVGIKKRNGQYRYLIDTPEWGELDFNMADIKEHIEHETTIEDTDNGSAER